MNCFCFLFCFFKVALYWLSCIKHSAEQRCAWFAKLSHVKCFDAPHCSPKLAFLSRRKTLCGLATNQQQHTPHHLLLPFHLITLSNMLDSPWHLWLSFECIRRYWCSHAYANDLACPMPVIWRTVVWIISQGEQAVSVKGSERVNARWSWSLINWKTQSWPIVSCLC